MGNEFPIEFFVPGKPVGYYAQANRKLYKMAPKQRQRAEEVRVYQEKVRIFAMQAGARLPIKATLSAPLIVETLAVFKNRMHADPENCHKLVKDALIPQDKYTAGFYEAPVYSGDPEKIGVWIKISEHSPDLDKERL